MVALHATFSQVRSGVVSLLTIYIARIFAWHCNGVQLREDLISGVSMLDEGRNGVEMAS